MSKSSFSSLHMYFGDGNCHHPTTSVPNFLMLLGRPKTLCSVLLVNLFLCLCNKNSMIRMLLRKACKNRTYHQPHTYRNESVHVPAWHLHPLLKGGRRNANTLLCHRFVAHTTSKLMGKASLHYSDQACRNLWWL